MKPNDIEHETWLDLSAAAAFLGVHFTTLRRWADAGEIAYIRTPGGRRRFSVKALALFVEIMSQGADLATIETGLVPLQERAIDHARQSVRSLSQTENWLGRMSDTQRARLKGTGHRLMALLLQFNSRLEGGEVFVDEGKRITREYSQVCSSIGLSLPETVHVFLFFRRSILDAIHETGTLSGADYEGLRLFRRTNHFLDELLLELIVSYQSAQDQTPHTVEGNLSPCN